MHCAKLHCDDMYFHSITVSTEAEQFNLHEGEIITELLYYTALVYSCMCIKRFVNVTEFNLYLKSEMHSFSPKCIYYDIEPGGKRHCTDKIK